MIWAHAGGPLRIERLFIALIGEFGERSPVAKRKAEIERQVVDPLTPGDLTEWLRDELRDLCLAMDRLDREARMIHGHGPLLLDKRLAARCRELRSEHGGRR